MLRTFLVWSYTFILKFDVTISIIFFFVTQLIHFYEFLPFSILGKFHLCCFSCSSIFNMTQIEMRSICLAFDLMEVDLFFCARFVPEYKITIIFNSERVYLHYWKWCLPLLSKAYWPVFFFGFWVFSVPFPFSRSLSHSLAQYNFRLKCMCLCMLRKIHFPSKSASLFSISVHFLKLRQWTQQIDRTINNNGLVSLQHKFIRLLFLFSFYFSIFPFNQIWHC